MIMIKYLSLQASQVALMFKNLSVNAGEVRDASLIPMLGRPPWRRKWQPTPVFLPGKSHGQRSLGLQFTGSQRAGHN